ncbi:hypothetical protein EVAR_38641_1 [Eumeta japonica]|uniref:Uncharacterized protein n=1 Tax=Eumeta variegata TaxID=151549 RepID=A0A4C1Y1Y1_EUMVA|nr:hypothetical protein EVAR_38641_1 [Eumeta japonica]
MEKKVFFRARDRELLEKTSRSLLADVAADPGLTAADDAVYFSPTSTVYFLMAFVLRGSSVGAGRSGTPWKVERAVSSDISERESYKALTLHFSKTTKFCTKCLTIDALSMVVFYTLGPARRGRGRRDGADSRTARP